MLMKMDVLVMGGDEVSSAFLFWRREDMPPVLFFSDTAGGEGTFRNAEYCG